MAAPRLSKPQDDGGPKGSWWSPLTLFSAPGTSAVLGASNAWIEGIRSVNQEMLSFCQAELHREIELSQALCRCSSFDEVINAARSTLDCYHQECGKLLDLFADAGRKALDGIRSDDGHDRRAGQLH